MFPSDLGTLDRKLAIFGEHCVAAGRDPAQAEVTVLDVPVIRRDRGGDRGEDPRQDPAGTADDHIGRYRLLAERGVRTVFVSLPDLAGPEDVLRLAPLAAAFT